MNITRIQATLQAYFTEDQRWAHSDRRLVFWYDENGQFQETFNELQLPAIEKIQLADIPFTTKYRLLIQEPTQSFILYAPFPEPPNNENWLLDLQKTGLTFSADPAALIYADLGLTQRSLENTIRLHRKFFDSRQRTTALQALQLSPNSNDKEFIIGMLSVLTKLKAPDATLLIRQVLMRGLLEDENPIWKEIISFISPEAFWSTVQDNVSFQDEKPSLQKLLVKLLISHLSFTLKSATPSTHKDFIISPSQRAYAFIDQWMRDQQDSQSLRDITQEIAQDLNLFQALEQIETEALIEATTFEQIDQILIRRCVQELLHSTPKLDRWKTQLTRRRTLFWSSDYLTTYDALEAAIRLLELKQQYHLGFAQSAQEIFKAYAKSLYQFDTAYRHFIYASDHAKPILREEKLIEHIEHIYVNWFLSELGQHWSDALAKGPVPLQWPLSNLPLQTNFFKDKIQGIIDRNDREKVFVIISDAFRYEVAAELQQQLIQELRGEAVLTAQLSPLPSITRLGMASLLPGQTLEFQPKDVLCDNMSTQGLLGRSNVLRANRGSEAIALQAADLLCMTIEVGRETIKPSRIIYIYHDVIDAIGDKSASERQVFDACKKAIEEIIKLTKRICNSLNGTHIVITADHGFLYQRQEIDLANKLPMPKEQYILEKIGATFLAILPWTSMGRYHFKSPMPRKIHLSRSHEEVSDSRVKAVGHSMSMAGLVYKKSASQS